MALISSWKPDDIFNVNGTGGMAGSVGYFAIPETIFPLVAPAFITLTEQSVNRTRIPSGAFGFMVFISEIYFDIYIALLL